MFEVLTEVAARLAQARAEARRADICVALAACLPPGVHAEAVAAGVRLAGRGLRRRLARDRALAASIAGVLK